MDPSSRKNGKRNSKVNTDNTGNLIYLAILGVILIFSFFSWKNSLRKFVKFGLIWFIIFILFIVVALAWENYRNEKFSLNSFDKDLKKLTLKTATDGHFYVTLSINNKPIDFLIDTGATAMILSKKDGEKLGFNVGNLNFSQLAQTANGEILIFPVVFDKVSLGFKNFSNFKAFISQKDMEKSLLGMSFLSRLKKLELGKNIMILDI